MLGVDEDLVGAIADVDDMTSNSGVGTTSIQLTFGIDRDIDGAARDVQAAIAAAHADLPTSLTRNPTYRKLNTASFPVIAIATRSATLPREKCSRAGRLRPCVAFTIISTFESFAAATICAAGNPLRVRVSDRTAQGTLWLAK